MEISSKTAKTKGDRVYQLLHGDNIEILKTLPSESVRCVVTSPPYFGLRDYEEEGQVGAENTFDEYENHLVEIFREVRRVLKSDGTVWLNLGDSFGGREVGRHDKITPGSFVGGDSKYEGATRKQKRRHTGTKHKDLLGLPWKIAFALRADGWWLRSDIIWAKPNPMPSSAKDRPTTAHEYIFLLAKSQSYYYDAEAVAEPAVAGGTRNKRSVWMVTPTHFKGAHFAVFPEKLIEPCILAGSRPGDTVLDPFVGSGTTGVVALKHERDFIGIDLNTDYLKMAEERIRPHSLQRRLL